MFFRHLFGQKGILVTLNHDLPSSTPRHLHRVTYIATEVRIPHHPDGQNFPWGVLLKAMSSLRATAGLSRARTSATTITGALSYNNGRSVCGHEHARYNHVPQPAITRAPPCGHGRSYPAAMGKLQANMGASPLLLQKSAPPVDMNGPLITTGPPPARTSATPPINARVPHIEMP